MSWDHLGELTLWGVEEEEAGNEDVLRPEHQSGGKRARRRDSGSEETTRQVRWAKILEVQASIAQGRYHISAQQVADSMLHRDRPGTGWSLDMYSA